MLVALGDGAEDFPVSMDALSDFDACSDFPVAAELLSAFTDCDSLGVLRTAGDAGGG